MAINFFLASALVSSNRHIRDWKRIKFSVFFLFLSQVTPVHNVIKQACATCCFFFTNLFFRRRNRRCSPLGVIDRHGEDATTNERTRPRHDGTITSLKWVVVLAGRWKLKGSKHRRRLSSYPARALLYILVNACCFRTPRSTAATLLARTN